MLIYYPEKMAVDLGGQLIRLTSTEAVVMQFLYHSAGDVCTPDDLGVALYGVDGWYNDAKVNQIEKIISRLRRRLGPHGFDFIKSVRGDGWYFDKQFSPETVSVEVSTSEVELLRYFRAIEAIDQEVLIASLNLFSQEARSNREACVPRVEARRPEPILQLSLFD